MKLGELLIEIGVIGDAKKLTQVYNQLKKNEKALSVQRKLEKALNRELTDREKLLVKNGVALKGIARNALAVGTALITAVTVFDRMANSMANANQKMINFQRQTGLSFSMLNKYASASASVNYGASIEGMANSLQNVANNLWEIRMGRGDISPYQELAFVGGRSVSVWGKSVEEVIEEVREAIKDVDGIQATNLITRMGFSPDDLAMLRMTREEVEQINSYFLNADQREAMYAYSKQLKEVHLRFQLLTQLIVLKLMPPFVGLMRRAEETAEIWARFGNEIIKTIDGCKGLQFVLEGLGLALVVFFARLHPVLAVLTMLYLILEDFAVFRLGGKSVLGLLFGSPSNGGKGLLGDLYQAQEIMTKGWSTEGIMGYIKALSVAIMKSETLSKILAPLQMLGLLGIGLWGNVQNIRNAVPSTGQLSSSSVVNNVSLYSSLPVTEHLNSLTASYGIVETQNAIFA